MHNQKTGCACGMILVVFGRWDKENYRFICDGEIMVFFKIWHVEYFERCKFLLATI